MQSKKCLNHKIEAPVATATVSGAVVCMEDINGTKTWNDDAADDVAAYDTLLLDDSNSYDEGIVRANI